MHPRKAIRTLAAIAALVVATGCETTADPVPKSTVVITRAEPVVVLAQAPAATPAPAATTTNPPVAEKKETVVVATTNAPAPTTLAASEPKPAATSTNDAPEIKEEIPPSIPENLKVTDATEKIVKLAQGGVDESVMLAFVENSQGQFDLEADEIVYLSDLGVSSAVLTAMLKKDGVDPAKADAITAAADTESDQPEPKATAAVQPAPQVVEVTTNYVPNTTVVQAPPQTVVVEQQPQTVVVTPAPTETVNYFYDSLSPYGSWMYVSDYGWCWQPTVAVVDRGWRPYGPRGHWIYSTSGWYWHSDYSWGWAPFHYGRWHMAGHRGWLWVPDRVWGPSWVSWRVTDDYCGWAPLPPAAVYRPGFGFSYYGSSVGVSFGFGLGADAYCFAPVGRFHDRHLWRHTVWGHRSHSHFHRSYVHNRYDWDKDRRHPRNNGVPRQQIERAINRELRPVEVREAPAQQTASRVGPRERFERNGRDGVIVRPSLPRADMASGIRTASSRTTPHGAPAPGAAVTAPVGDNGNSGRFNRTGAGRSVSQTPVAPAPTPQAPTTPTPSASGRFPRADRTATATQPAPTPATTIQPSVEQRIGAGRRDRVFGSTSPASPTTAPVPTVTAPAPAPVTSPAPSGREGVRREINRGTISRPSTVAPPVASPTPDIRRDRFNATPAPQVSAPSSRIVSPAPQPMTPSPRVSSPATESISRSPRIISPAPQPVSPPSRYSAAPPQSVSPAPRYSAPAPSPRYSSPAPQPVSPAPRSVSPSAPSAGRGYTTTPSVSPRYSAPAPAPSRSAPSVSPSPAPSRAPSPSPSSGSNAGSNRGDRREGNNPRERR